MKFTTFDPPANVPDFNTAALAGKYSAHVSKLFDDAVARIDASSGGGPQHLPQFYNPVTQGLPDADTILDIPWNGFPRRFIATTPGAKPAYAQAEPAFSGLPAAQGRRHRPQDEYLEWFVHRDAQQRIVRVDFTCEAYDYYQFLASVKPQAVVNLYKKHVDPLAKKADLFDSQGRYNPWNEVNLKKGAMHLTHPANALAAEIFLAGDATVRRRRNGAEPATAAALIACAGFGDGARNSDPKIGFDVNSLARQGFMVTLTNPVGLYMVGFNDAGWKFADGVSARGLLKILRGAPGRAVRATFELTPALKQQGRTVSDVLIGGVPIAFGGQIAERITMGIQGAACRPGSVNNGLVACAPLLAAGPGLMAGQPKQLTRA